jgi:hypothetical protein
VIVNADSRVDDYISWLPDWQQAICRQVRQLVHDADPEVEETIKRSVLPYFVLQGNVCALLAAKDHVNVFIYDPTVADPHGVINQGHGNATAGPFLQQDNMEVRLACTGSDVVRDLLFASSGIEGEEVGSADHDGVPAPAGVGQLGDQGRSRYSGRPFPPETTRPSL